MNNNWIETMITSCDTQLENILLCKLLISKKMLPDIQAEYFTGIRSNIYKSIEKQWTELKCIDPVLIKKSYPDAIIDILKESGSNSPAIIDQIQNLWKRRELAKLLCESASIEDIDAVLGKIQAGTGQIALKHGSTEYNHAAAVNDLLISLKHTQTRDVKIAGYSTGIDELDKYLSGIEKGKMYCIGALKKSGKSRFAIYLSLMLRQAGAGVLWNSLEMNAIQLNFCALAYFSKIDQRTFGRTMTKEEYSETVKGFSGVVDLDWIICREKTISNLRARIILERNKKTVDVVIVDFIQRMQDESKESRTKEVEAISIGLADLSRELNVAMIVLSQLAGYAEKLGEDEMPNMSHMKESQGIAENADAIITLHNFGRRDNPFKEDGTYKVQEIHCLIEQRYDVSGCCFRFLGDLRTCMFKNHEDPYGGKNKDD